jgi:hypothetical protein
MFITDNTWQATRGRDRENRENAKRKQPLTMGRNNG